MSQTVIIASTNPVKIDATRTGFGQMLPDADWVYEGIAVPSGVSDQPMGHAETLRGARNRAQGALEARPDAVYGVGIEGGIARDFDDPEQLQTFAWVVVMHRDASGNIRHGRGQTGVFYLPQEVAQLVIEAGMELGHADDVVFGRTNSKQANGSIGILTHDVMTRLDFYVPAVIIALIPFVRPDLTWR